MIYLVIASVFVIAYMYDKHLIASVYDKHRLKVNKLNLRIAELEARRVAPTDGVKVVNHISDEALSKHASCIVVDDPWVPGTKLTDEKRQELSEALESLIDRKWDDDAPLIIIRSRVHDEDLPWYIDGTLDYSWITPQIRGTHPYSFRSGEWADILGITGVDIDGSEPRPCFICGYSDGVLDYLPVCDQGNYEIRS